MIQGIPSAPGLGAGPAYLLLQEEIPVTEINRAPKRLEEEVALFTQGQSITAKFYQGLIEAVRSKLGDDEAEIFEGHLEMIQGDDIREGVVELLETGNENAISATLMFTEQTANEFEAMDSEYFRQRAGDFRDMGKRLTEAMYFGRISGITQLPPNTVLLVHELTPSITASLPVDQVAGLATETGGPTSHAAILSRSLGIPCITGALGCLSQVSHGELCLVNGDTGVLEIGVSQALVDETALLREKSKKVSEALAQWSKFAKAVMADGTPVTLGVNCSSAKDAEKGVLVGAEGSGLVRTEFIFLEFSQYPTVSEQTEKYREICQILAPHPVTIRLLDCGADKPLPYSGMEPEENPFLGERGIRFLQSHPEQLINQIKALAQVSAEGFPVQVMIPMVISLEEVQQVREIAQSIAPKMPIGIMVETPASVFSLESLVKVADFVSIGTNDLVQYILAVDRGNARVAHLYRELDPGVLKAIDRIVQVCQENNTPLGVCGDMASRPLTALALLALGVRKLSATGTAVPQIKKLVQQVTEDQLSHLKNKLLHSSKEEPRDLLTSFLMEEISLENQ
jgi:phosphotransferase system enzyme I (PtsI)